MFDPKSKILGIDYGDKRVGLSVAAFESMAIPYTIIENKSFSFLLSELNKVIAEENITVVVVGLPRSLSGNSNERLVLTEKFITQLKQNLDLKIFTVDEQYTSKLYSQQGVKKDLDKYAATAILETWLAQNHHA